MQVPIKILILEDQLIIAEDIADMLRDEGYEVAGMAGSYDQAVTLLETTKPNFALLDITVSGQKKGTDVGKLINQYYHIPFVYLTSHSDRDTLNEVKLTNPSGYLMKPFLRKNLLATIEIALHNFSQQNLSQKLEEKPLETDDGVVINAHYIFKDGYKHVKLPFSDILYFKSDGNYAELKTATKKYLLRTTMKKIQGQLPTAEFARCHKQYIVNLSKVIEFSTNQVSIGREQIPVGREYKENVCTAMLSR